LPATELVIADPQTHAPLPAGATGEIKLRGFVMPGYFRDPQKTSESMDGEGFFLTGDLGMLDEAGYLHFRGRLKEIVKSGGINISPAEVEEILRSHDDVEQAFAFGVPDDVRDEVLAAGLVLKKNSSLSVDQLKAFCRERMATYKIPNSLFFLAGEQVPLTATGKPDKASLQRRFIDEQRATQDTTQQRDQSQAQS
jgi:fatty-acyl-CoA synthase